LSSVFTCAAVDVLVNRPRYSSASFRDGKLIAYELRAGARGISCAVAVERR